MLGYLVECTVNLLQQTAAQVRRAVALRLHLPGSAPAIRDQALLTSVTATRCLLYECLAAPCLVWAVLPYAHCPLLRAPTKNPQEDNSVAEIYLQIGQDSIAQRACADMLEQVAGEPCYNTLRTQEQLGYSVGCGVRLTHAALGFAFTVVSGPRKTAARSPQPSAVRGLACHCVATGPGCACFDGFWPGQQAWLSPM